MSSAILLLMNDTIELRDLVNGELMIQNFSYLARMEGESTVFYLPAFVLYYLSLITMLMQNGSIYVTDYFHVKRYPFKLAGCL
ncbi:MULTISPECIES: hypothetical protein [Bacillaceae]|uniref:hypothetical protein n=1 Tax=Bacillaceae TaxID=186817 RepID=UPI0005A5FF3F|nr:hypothetical protein [Bacillus rubiinfantis]